MKRSEAKGQKLARAGALIFLAEIAERAARYSDAIDPARRLDYEHDPVLKALDAITEKASHALAVVEAAARVRS